jgi:hypothetical protein
MSKGDPKPSQINHKRQGSCRYLEGNHPSAEEGFFAEAVDVCLGNADNHALFLISQVQPHGVTRSYRPRHAHDTKLSCEHSYGNKESSKLCPQGYMQVLPNVTKYRKAAWVDKP